MRDITPISDKRDLLPLPTDARLTNLTPKALRVIETCFDQSTVERYRSDIVPGLTKDSPNGYMLWGLMAGGKMLAVATVHTGRCVTISHVAVPENYRRKGFATELLARLTENIRQQVQRNGTFMDIGIQAADSEAGRALLTKMGLDVREIDPKPLAFNLRSFLREHGHLSGVMLEGRLPTAAALTHVTGL